MVNFIYHSKLKKNLKDQLAIKKLRGWEKGVHLVESGGTRTSLLHIDAKMIYLVYLEVKSHPATALPRMEMTSCHISD